MPEVLKRKRIFFHNAPVEAVEATWWSFPAGISGNTFAVVTVAGISAGSTGAPHVSKGRGGRVPTLAGAASDPAGVSGSPQGEQL